ncbi:NlpC/P60 family protein [uncultured Leuconostoc sp.]|uniref:NlpC/P60 family protein n=1 Tax=uncultured Leuconostoc sp. TaxID=173262 RepID=UPI0025DE72E2|nr:NlpC/P60 family protein [uncultured Leuconostoc sp.]
MANKWLDVALTQLGKSYHSSGAFVAFVINTSKIEINVKTNHFSQTLSDLVQEMSDVKKIENARPGDLLFWGKPDHPYSVGIYIGGGHFISVAEKDAVVKVQLLKQNLYPDFVGNVF